MTTIKPQYSVEVLGFSPTERIVLNSIFDLSARRSPQFVPHSAITDGAPDMYLVDCNDIEALAQFQRKNATGDTAAVLIGEIDHGLPFPVLPRPLQWAKLFHAFDAVVGESARHSGEPPPHDAANANRVHRNHR